MQRRYVIADVFTDRPFGGNPLAVMLDAEGLSQARMQAIASEFNLSETSFVLPPADPAHTARVRIFTPAAEIPFAGHPNVGTAFVLATLAEARGEPLGDRLVFEEDAGLVPVEIRAEGGRPVGATLTAPQPLSLGAELPVELVAACIGLEPATITTERHRPVVGSVGIPFVLVELADRAALVRARPRADRFEALPPDAVSIHMYIRDRLAGGGGEVDLRARMFDPTHGIPEDPATGSANAALAALLATIAPEAGLSLRLTIAQGVEMGRPSLLEAAVEKRGGTVGEVRIGGRCVRIMAGTIDAAD